MYNKVVLLGILVSMLFSEFIGISPAGLIVPGYIALCAHSPLRIVYTLALSFVTALICRGLRSFMILYGRRLFAMMILVSCILSFIVKALGVLPFAIDPIGYLVPGIIARDFDRQGFVKTVGALAAATAVILLVLVLCGWPVRGIL